MKHNSEVVQYTVSFGISLISPEWKLNSSAPHWLPASQANLSKYFHMLMQGYHHRYKSYNVEKWTPPLVYFLKAHLNNNYPYTEQVLTCIPTHISAFKLIMTMHYRNLDYKITISFSWVVFIPRLLNKCLHNLISKGNNWPFWDSDYFIFW